MWYKSSLVTLIYKLSRNHRCWNAGLAGLSFLYRLILQSTGLEASDLALCENFLSHNVYFRCP